MTNPEFPDVTYDLSKLSEGISRQDYAELAALKVPGIREALKKYKPDFTDPLDKLGYDSTLESVMRHLDELEKYYLAFHLSRSRISQTAARGFHDSLRKQVDGLRQLSSRQ